MNIVANFNNSIRNCYFKEYKNVNTISLDEKKQPGCNFNLKIANSQSNHFLVIKDLEKLKVQDAVYIHKDPPKDCDYIILDLIKCIIYFIDLKDRKNLEPPKEMMLQLISGEKWLSHLLFCSGCDDILETWKKRWIVFQYRSMRSSPKGYPTLNKDVLNRKLYTYTGTFLHIEKLK